MSFLSKIDLKKLVTASESFSTEIEEIFIPRSMFGIFDKDALISIKGAKLTWMLAPEYRQDRIKGLGIYVPDQEITISGEVDDKPFAKKVAMSNVTITYDFDEISYLSIEPVSIDYYSNKWTVAFRVG